MKEEYRRNLPHFQPQSAMFFITFRLFGSIPRSKLEQLKTSNQLADNNNLLKNSKHYIDHLDSFLEKGPNGPYYLSNPAIAKIVYDSIHFLNGRNFKLVCFCIMSNHVHIIIYKLQKPLHIILKELKSYTGKEANKILRNLAAASSPNNLSLKHSHNFKFAKFWQAESFDRVVRNREDLSHKIEYVLNNPVNAGLVKHWRDWKWSYCSLEFTDY